MQHRTIEEVKVGQQAPQEAQLLVGVVDSSQLGSPEKLTELEKIQLLQRKIEHGMTIPTIKEVLAVGLYFMLQTFFCLLSDCKVNHRSAMNLFMSVDLPKDFLCFAGDRVHIFPSYRALWIVQKTVYEVAESSDIPLIQCGQNRSYCIYNNCYICVDTKKDIHIQLIQLD